MKFFNFAFLVSFIWVFDILRSSCVVEATVNESGRETETGQKCESETKKLVEERNKIEKNLQKCFEENKNQSVKYKNESNELRNRITSLEEMLKDNKVSSDKSSGSGSSTCPASTGYLISYDIMKNYFIKIFKIYKTFYFVLVEKTILSSVFSKAKDLKNMVLVEIKMNRSMIYEQCKKGMSTILQMSFVQKGIETFYKLKQHKVASIGMKYGYDTYETVKGSAYMGYNIILPKLYTMKDNMKIMLNVVNTRLQKNSDMLLEQLYFVNPEIKGIIPEKLSDQFILMLFFTFINVLFLYLFIYFFFVIFKVLKFICLFIIRAVRCMISTCFRSVIFVVTLPMRPFMKKKTSKNRKVYKSHAENVYNNPDRSHYQQTEFKKMNKNQYTKHRK